MLDVMIPCKNLGASGPETETSRRDGSAANPEEGGGGGAARREELENWRAAERQLRQMKVGRTCREARAAGCIVPQGRVLLQEKSSITMCCVALCRKVGVGPKNSDVATAMT